MTVLVPLLLLVLLGVCIWSCCSDGKNRVEALPEPGEGDDKVGTRPDNQIKFSEYSDDEQRSDRNKGEELESIDQISEMVPPTQ